MTYVKVSLPKRGTAASPVPKGSNIILINVKDLAVDANGVITGFPPRDAKGIKMSTPFTLKPTEKAIAQYATPSTIKRMDTTDGGDDAKGFMQAVEYEAPGDELEQAEFVQANINEDFIIITTECSESTGTRVHGTPCNPMKLTFESQDDNEAKKGMFKWSSIQRSKFKMAHYYADLPTIAAATEVGSSGGGI